MRNESPLLANTGLSLFQACHSLWAIFWGQGATQWLFQLLPPHLPGKKDSSQAHSLEEKWGRDERNEVLGGAGNEAGNQNINWLLMWITQLKECSKN